MTDIPDALVEKAAEVVAVHRWKTMGVSSVTCECGDLLYGDDSLTQFPADEAFREHLARAVLAAVLPDWAKVTAQSDAWEECNAKYADLAATVQRVRALADEMENDNTERARVRRYWAGRVRAALAPSDPATDTGGEDVV